MSQKLVSLLNKIAHLRFELVKGAKGRRQRFRILDRYDGKVVAKFDDEMLAKEALATIRKRYVKEIENELTTESLPTVQSA